MEENKQVTAEEILLKHIEAEFGKMSLGDFYRGGNAIYTMHDVVILSHEEYATLKNQQLTAANELIAEEVRQLRNANGYKNEQIQQLTTVFKRLLHVYINAEWQRNQHFSEAAEASVIQKWLTEAGMNLTHKED